MDKISKPRITWIDFAKGLTIILMVYGHVMRGVNSAGLIQDVSFFNLSDKFFFSFRMPLFVILSGLFFLKSLNKYGTEGLIINRFRTVLYPYIVWSFLHTLIEVILSNYTNGQLNVSELLTCIFIPRAHFWFLFALFFINLINIGLYIFFKNKWLIISFVIASICYFGSLDLSIFTLSLRYLLFFNIGILVSSLVFEYKTVEMLSSMKVLIIALLSFILIQYLNLFSDINNILLRFCIAIISSFFCISISAFICNYDNKIIRLIKSVGKNTSLLVKIRCISI